MRPYFILFLIVSALLTLQGCHHHNIPTHTHDSFQQHDIVVVGTWYEATAPTIVIGQISASGDNSFGFAYGLVMENGQGKQRAKASASGDLHSGHDGNSHGTIYQSFTFPVATGEVFSISTSNVNGSMSIHGEWYSSSAPTKTK